MTETREPAMKYFPKNKQDALQIKNPRMRVIKRDQPIGPGVYKPNLEFVEPVNPGWSFAKSKNINFYDTYKSRKAFVPGVGKYKDVEKCYDQLSRPTTMKSVRQTRQ